jgi:hypothetical protein
VSRFDRRAWLLPVVFVAHVAEEAPGFTRWARRHASHHYTQRDFVRNNAAGLVLTVGATWAVGRFRARPVTVGWHSALLTQQALWNPAFHLGTTIAWRRYSPGLVTAVLVFLPTWLHLTRLALREDRLSRGDVAAGTVAAAAPHATVVAQQVFFIGAAGRRPR